MFIVADFHHIVRRDGIIVPQHLSKDENRILRGIKNILFRSHQPQDRQRSLSLIQYYLFEYNLTAMKSFTDSTAQEILGIYNDLKGSLCSDDHAKITPFIKYYQQVSSGNFVLLH